METPNAIAAERLVHAHALQLLSEVRDYLMRLPVVPATREFARQIDGFLTEPNAKVAQAHARQQQALALKWDGASFTPVGEPLLMAQMNFEQPSVAARAPTPRDRMLTVAGAVLKDVASLQVATPRGDVYPALCLWLRPAEEESLRLLPREK